MVISEGSDVFKGLFVQSTQVVFGRSGVWAVKKKDPAHFPSVIFWEDKNEEDKNVKNIGVRWLDSSDRRGEGPRRDIMWRCPKQYSVNGDGMASPADVCCPLTHQINWSKNVQENVILARIVALVF